MPDWIRILLLLLIVEITRKLLYKFHRDIRAKITKRFKWGNFILCYLVISILLSFGWFKISSTFHIIDAIDYLVMGVILGSFISSVVDSKS